MGFERAGSGICFSAYPAQIGPGRVVLSEGYLSQSCPRSIDRGAAQSVLLALSVCTLSVVMVMVVVVMLGDSGQAIGRLLLAHPLLWLLLLLWWRRLRRLGLLRWWRLRGLGLCLVLRGGTEQWLHAPSATVALLVAVSVTARGTHTSLLFLQWLLFTQGVAFILSWFFLLFL